MSKLTVIMFTIIMSLNMIFTFVSDFNHSYYEAVVFCQNNYSTVERFHYRPFNGFDVECENGLHAYLDWLR